MNIENNSEIKMAFAIRTPYEVYVADNTQELVDIIYNRHSIEAEIWRLNSLEEANTFMCQIHPQRHYANPACFGIPPMPIPTSGTYQLIYPKMQQRYTELKNTKNDELPPNMGFPILANEKATRMSLMYNATVCWGIDALNGFATAPDLDALVYHLSNTEVVYPHAVAWPDYYSAFWNAKVVYTQRFYRRYSGINESILLPNVQLNEGDAYVDEVYEERENHRKDDPLLNKFISVGIL